MKHPTPRPNEAGTDVLKAALRRGRPLLLAVFLFSLFINLLMLTGPLFMMQVYDRVLGSRSEATLVALFVLVAFLYGVMGVLDYVRGRLLARVGDRIRDALEKRCWDASMDARSGATKASASPMQDLDALHRLFSSPLPPALCDIPWTPVFLGAIFLFHPSLGLLACAGGALLITFTVLNQILSKTLQKRATLLGASAQASADQARSEIEVVRALGMRNALHHRWKTKSQAAVDAAAQAGDRTGIFSSLSKTFRMFLQSAMLALGAWQVLQGEMTGGSMIAGSILMGRALAPIDSSISQWPVMQRARLAWAGLGKLFSRPDEHRTYTDLPRPKGDLEVSGLTIIAPESRSPILRAVSFTLPAGKALGLIGPSGSGKSTIARAVTGVLPPAAGTIRLDGAALDQYEPDALGALIGYLPQRIQLFDGTIAENIARMSPRPDDEAVVRAAKAAQAHELILGLPEGYDTPVSASDPMLSGGQLQRVALARALYGDPPLVVLDEPNSNLDEKGSEAVNGAVAGVKKRGGSVIIIAHRPSAILQCEALLHLDGGQVRALGPRNEVLKSQVSNHAQISGGAKERRPRAVTKTQGRPT